MSKNHWVFYVLIVCSQHTQAWGPLGHELAAEIAESRLSPRASEYLSRLLPHESLAQASTWADQMRGNPGVYWQEKSGAYHYVTVADGSAYSVYEAPRKGDAVTALNEFRAILENPDSSRAHQQLALRFSVHIVADLHQPLHVGTGEDRGGNNTKVKFGGKATSLHRLWDSDLINYRGWNKRQWLRQLTNVADVEQTSRKTDPGVWIGESKALRPIVYSHTRNISDAYIKRSQPVIDRRLYQAALRTAAYLELLANSRI